MAENTNSEQEYIEAGHLKYSLPTILPSPINSTFILPTTFMDPSAAITTQNLTDISSHSHISAKPNLITANFRHDKINQINHKSKFRMDPPRFHGSSSQDIMQWLTYYERACRVNSWETDTERARYLPCFLESAASLWFDNIEQTATAQNLSSYTYLKAELIKAFYSSHNADIIEHTLRTRKMAPGEDVSTYYHSMLNLCRRSNATMADEAIVRHMIFGLSPILMKHMLLMDNNSPNEFYKNAMKVERTLHLTGNNPTELTDITAKLTDIAKSVAEIQRPIVNVIHEQSDLSGCN